MDITHTRKCYDCGTKIHACMGYVKAGDFVELIKGKRKGQDVRELCGICLEKREAKDVQNKN